MFYYYGGKKRLAALYPHPRFRVVVEPFAGGAGYSMHHLVGRHIDRAVLVEKDPRVVQTWRRILSMTPEQIRAVPVPPAGASTDDFLVMTAAASNAAARSSRVTVSNRQGPKARRMLSLMARHMPAVTGKVEVIEGDFRDAPRLHDATYFVDPPYQPVRTRASKAVKGLGYAAGCDAAAIDYDELASWVRDLPGQVIVAEQQGADWLPFEPLHARHRDSLGCESAEVFWTSHPPPPRLTLFDA